MDGMNDMGMDAPPIEEAPAVKGTGPGTMEQCVPLASLAMPEDGSDQMASPEVGDQVHYTIEGKVTRIDGDNAYVEPESVNGQPVEKNEGPAEETGEDALPGIQRDAEAMGYLK